MDVSVQQSFWISQAARVRLQPLGDGMGACAGDLTGVLSILGSGNDGDVTLPSSKADAAHAAIVLLGNSAYVCDLGAPGGTSLNGRRIRWARLAHGDELAVGGCRLGVELQEDPASATSEQPSFWLHDAQTAGDAVSIDPVLVVGSDPGCDVVLNEDSVAPRQCLVVWTQEGPMLRNLRCDERVRLNGEKVQTARLVSGDLIRVGSHDLTFEIDLGTGDFAGLGEPTSRSERETGRRQARGRGDSDSGVVEQRRISGLVSGQLSADAVGLSRQLWPAPGTVRSPVSAEDRETIAEPELGGTPRRHSDEDETTFAQNEHCDETAAEEDADLSGQRTEPAGSSDDSPTIEQDAETGRQESAGHGGESSEGVLTRMRARVAAAQKALDQRAMNHLERLNQERIRLQAYQIELQRKASELLQVARENRRLLHRGRQAEESEAVRDRSNEEASAEMHSADSTVNETRAAGVAPNNVGGETQELGGLSAEGARRSLQQHATDLANLVRQEQDEIDRAESQFASLRTGIRRLREFVERADAGHRVRVSEWEARLGTLQQEESCLAREREQVAAKLGELDARAGRVRAKMEDAGRDRQDLDHQMEQLAQAQKKLVEKEEALRTGLELERRRIEVRQAELQRKATDLARSARDKRCTIEADLVRRKAALDLQEAELQAHRAAIEEAGRVELEKAAVELERVLSVPVGDSKRERLESRLDPDSGAGEAAGQAAFGGRVASDQTDGRNQPSSDKTEEQTKVLAHMLHEAMEGREKRLVTLQEELMAIKGAMIRLGRRTADQSSTPSGAGGSAQAPATADRRGYRRLHQMLGGQANKLSRVLRGANERENDDRADAASEAVVTAFDSDELRGVEERPEGS